MKKVISFLLISFILTACAGNPPAWWNPRGIGITSNAAQGVATQPAKETAPAEENLQLSDESYEEMALTPLEIDNEEERSAALLEEENLLPPPSVLGESF